MPNQGYIEGYAGQEICLTVDGIKIMSLQKLTWKATQKKSIIRGAGYPNTPHAVGRGPKEYELDFEVKELNQAVIVEQTNARNGARKELKTFKVGEQEVSDILDLRNMTVLVMYPDKNNVVRTLKFTGVEFTGNEGGFSLEDESVGRKLTAIAMNGEGLI